MDKIAIFQKTSFEEFSKGFINCFPQIEEKEMKKVYETIKIPRRATSGSAGYDFFLPTDITLHPGEGITIPTGIRAKIAEGWVLLLFPRSGLGFKYRLQLDNSVGVIDADYYGADNEGHIFIRMTNDSRTGKTLSLCSGDAFAQGIFLLFGVTVDDAAAGKRTGGFGSTSKEPTEA